MTELKFLNPCNDFAFHKVFCLSENKNLLINLLNALMRLSPDNKIVNLSFLEKIFQVPLSLGKKSSILELWCQLSDGSGLVLEVHLDLLEQFEKRALYYGAKAYVDQLIREDNSGALYPVHILVLSSEILFPSHKNYRSCHRVFDEISGESIVQDINFLFFELPKFNKDVLVTVEEQWLYFFKYAHSSDSVSTKISNPEVLKAYDLIEKSFWTADDMLCYEDAILAQLDDNLMRLENYRRGERDGVKKGVSAGRQEGEKEGIKKGRLEERIEIARSMLTKGIAKNMIQDVTGLARNVIEKL